MTRTADVVAGQMLDPAWGNEVRDRSMQVFASTAERDGWTSPPNGATCVTLDTNIQWQRIAGVWQPLSPIWWCSKFNTKALSASLQQLTPSGGSGVGTVQNGNLIAVSYPGTYRVQANMTVNFSPSASGGWYVNPRIGRWRSGAQLDTTDIVYGCNQQFWAGVIVENFFTGCLANDSFVVDAASDSAIVGTVQNARSYFIIQRVGN